MRFAECFENRLIRVALEDRDWALGKREVSVPGWH